MLNGKFPKFLIKLNCKKAQHWAESKSKWERVRWTKLNWISSTTQWWLNICYFLNLMLYVFYFRNIFTLQSHKQTHRALGTIYFRYRCSYLNLPRDLQQVLCLDKNCGFPLFHSFKWRRLKCLTEKCNLSCAFSVQQNNIYSW